MTVIFGNAGNTAITPEEVKAQEVMVLKGSSDAPYSPYGVIDTLTLPSSVTLRSAGSVAEVYDLETGKKTNIRVANLKTDISWTPYNNGIFYSTSLSALIKKPASSSDLGNYTCSMLTQKTGSADWGYYQFNISQSGQLWARTDGTATSASSFADELADVYLNYEPATPDVPTQLDPVENPYIATEAGGTISSILTDPVDDNMNLGYLNL